MAGMSIKADEEVTPGYLEAKAMAVAPPLPPAKNMMWTESVEFFLRCQNMLCPRTGKVDLSPTCTTSWKGS
jgi:hypothetical protein